MTPTARSVVEKLMNPIPVTSVGASPMLTVESTPTCPKVLKPQQRTLPLLKSIQVVRWMAATLVTVCVVPKVIGTDEEMGDV